MNPNIEMTDHEAIRLAYHALCKYNSPSLTQEQRQQALGECWDILATASSRQPTLTQKGRINNWINGEEMELE